MLGSRPTDRVAADPVRRATEGSPVMVKWSYKRVTFDIFEIDQPDFEAKLNKVGDEGWELVSTFDRERGGNSKECFFLFKRPG